MNDINIHQIKKIEVRKVYLETTNCNVTKIELIDQNKKSFLINIFSDKQIKIKEVKK